MNTQAAARDRDAGEYGFRLLRILSLAGWQITVTVDGVSARKFAVGEIQMSGDVADVAVPLFVKAVEKQARARLNGHDEPPSVRLRIVS